MTSTSEDAADDLVRELAWVRRLARRLVGDDGDDLSQDVAAIALARPPRGGLRAWLGAVTRRRAARWHRDRRRRAEVEVSGSAEDLADVGAGTAEDPLTFRMRGANRLDVDVGLRGFRRADLRVEVQAAGTLFTMQAEREMWPSTLHQAAGSSSTRSASWNPRDGVGSVPFELDDTGRVRPVSVRPDLPVRVRPSTASTPSSPSIRSSCRLPGEPSGFTSSPGSWSASCACGWPSSLATLAEGPERGWDLELNQVRHRAARRELRASREVRSAAGAVARDLGGRDDAARRGGCRAGSRPLGTAGRTQRAGLARRTAVGPGRGARTGPDRPGRWLRLSPSRRSSRMRPSMRRPIPMFFTLALAGCSTATTTRVAHEVATPEIETVTDPVAEVLSLFGHRNWIVIADAAYPKQSAAGIRTVHVGGDQLEVVAHVLAAVDAAPHVRAKVRIDAELDAVPDELAPGIAGYRDALLPLLEGRGLQMIPHETIIERLDAAARTFDVLIVKTDMALPYTSVFLELDCGYWSGESESALRERMRR